MRSLTRLDNRRFPIEYQSEEVSLVRNQKNVVKLVPQNKGRKAPEVMSDLYRTLPEDVSYLIDTCIWIDVEREKSALLRQKGDTAEFRSMDL